MGINEKQKNINPDPRYWDWFQKWWDEDYSWDGLKNKTTTDGTPLQDHYARNKQYCVDKYDKIWHPVNLPPHDPDGNVKIDKRTDSDALNYAINTISIEKITELHGIVWPKLGIAVKNAYVHWCQTNAFNQNTATLYGASECYIDFITTQLTTINKCTIALKTFSFVKHHTKKIAINRSTFPPDFSILCAEHSEISIINCSGGESINIHAKRVNIENLKSKFIKIHAIPRSADNSRPEFNIALSKREKTELIIEPPDTGELKYAMARISLGPHHTIVFRNIHFNNIKFVGIKIGNLFIQDCLFENIVSLKSKNIRDLMFIRSVFREGLDCTKLICTRTANILGTKIYETGDFSHATFENGLILTETAGTEKYSEDSIISNSRFVKTRFCTGIKNDEYSCAIFNDTRFLGSAKFDEAVFEGVPKFHGCKLHQETSFRNLAPFPFVDKQATIEEEPLYSEYQAAFRTLRQHMEENNFYADAFKFGRLEMIAKQKRVNSNDVPKWERDSSEFYGSIADYGQSAILPLKILLLRVIPFFVIFQISVIWLSGKCLFFSNSCKFDSVRFIEGVERSMIFALPPFTLLTDRAIGKNSNVEIDPFWQVISGLGMVAHAAISTLLIFVFLLAMKRRLQIR